MMKLYTRDILLIYYSMSILISSHQFLLIWRVMSEHVQKYGLSIELECEVLPISASPVPQS